MKDYIILGMETELYEKNVQDSNRFLFPETIHLGPKIPLIFCSKIMKLFGIFEL